MVTSTSTVEPPAAGNDKLKRATIGNSYIAQCGGLTSRYSSACSCFLNQSGNSPVPLTVTAPTPSTTVYSYSPTTTASTVSPTLTTVSTSITKTVTTSFVTNTKSTETKTIVTTQTVTALAIQGDGGENLGPIPVETSTPSKLRKREEAGYYIGFTNEPSRFELFKSDKSLRTSSGLIACAAAGPDDIEAIYAETPDELAQGTCSQLACTIDNAGILTCTYEGSGNVVLAYGPADDDSPNRQLYIAPSGTPQSAYDMKFGVGDLGGQQAFTSAPPPPAPTTTPSTPPTSDTTTSANPTDTDLPE
ncbi:hypothetical protein ABW20_dc0102793 [Dactylellina cionopaga]|nr:hypothetical protein ABW20_dc0102793 [Dactylellina cionopaga]